MAGYNGYSMSNNAREAYSNGEMPKSKWNKTNIIDMLETELDENAEEKIELLKELDGTSLKDYCLERTSWHHTSKYYNETDFYSINVDKIEELDVETLREDINRLKKYKQQEREERKLLRRAKQQGFDKFYIDNRINSHIWNCAVIEDTVIVPIDKKCTIFKKLSDNNDFYVLDSKDEATLKVQEYNRRKIEKITQKKIEELQPITQVAKEWLVKELNGNSKYYIFSETDYCVSGGLATSRNGHIYASGRKPSPDDYMQGLENFFNENDYRLAFDNNIWKLERWNGKEFESAEPTKKSNIFDIIPEKKRETTKKPVLENVLD